MGVFDLLGMAMGQAFQGESIVAWMSSARIHPVKQRQVVSVWKLLETAHGSTAFTGEMAARQMLAYQQLVDRSVAVGRLVPGRSALQGFGMFATTTISEQMVVAEFTGKRISEAVAERRRVGLNVAAGKGDSEEKRVIFFSLKKIAKGGEIMYS